MTLDPDAVAIRIHAVTAEHPAIAPEAASERRI